LPMCSATPSVSFISVFIVTPMSMTGPAPDIPVEPVPFSVYGSSSGLLVVQSCSTELFVRELKSGGFPTYPTSPA
jgi:hypothetical protein